MSHFALCVLAGAADPLGKGFISLAYCVLRDDSFLASWSTENKYKAIVNFYTSKNSSVHINYW